jgi:hypothetical protein
MSAFSSHRLTRVNSPSPAAAIAKYFRSALNALPILLVALAAQLPVHAQDNPSSASSSVEHVPFRAMPAFTNTPAASEGAVQDSSFPSANPATSIVGADSDNTNPTAWWVYAGQTPSQVSTLLTNLNARIIDLQVDSAAPTFTVTLVSNTGAYAKSWWWYYNATTAQISSLLSTNNARLISVKGYLVSGQVRFAAVMISNTGADAKSWWWYVGQSVSGISTLVSNNNARLIAVDPYSDGSSTVYSAIMISNTGADSSAWWWYVNASVTTISNAISQNSARVFYLSAGSSGTFNAIMESCSGAGCPEWWWYVGQTGTGLLNIAGQNGARLVNVTTYPGCGSVCFAGPMINNSNAITTHVGNLLRNGGIGGTKGLYLKRVSGAVLANLEDGFVYEPASAIKVVENLYSLKQVQGGSIQLNSPITHYVNGPESCPNPPSVSGTERLDLAMREMMWHSDNARTAEILDHFGFGNINSYATSIGMSNTKFNSYPGCGSGTRNTFTLDDANALYEGVANQTLLPQRYRGIFYSSMAGRAQYESEGYDWTAVWSTDIPNIINQVAPAGSTAAQKTAYMNAMNVAYKAGSYVLCQSDCAHILEDVDIAGWFQIPVCSSSGTVTYAQYTWGIFFADVPDNSWFSGKTTVADTNFTSAKSELMREPIRAGMKSCAGKSFNVMTYSPASLVFPATTVGSVSGPMTITVTNNQPTTVSSVGVSLFGEFIQSSNCPTSLTTGQSCTITVKFKPAGTGERTGAVIVADGGVGHPHTIELTGTGK